MSKATWTVGQCGCGKTVALVETHDERNTRYLVETFRTSLVAPDGSLVNGHSRHQCNEGGVFMPGEKVSHEG